MAKARIGHFAEAQILEAIGVDMIDESEGKCATDSDCLLLKFDRDYNPAISNAMEG